MPWLLGINRNEGTIGTAGTEVSLHRLDNRHQRRLISYCLLFAGIFSNKKVLKHFTNNLNRLLPIQLQYNDSPKRESITQNILDKYFHNKPLDQSFYGMADVSYHIYLTIMEKPSFTKRRHLIHVSSKLLQIFSIAFFICGGFESALNYNGVKYFYLYDHENKVNYVRNYFLRGVITKYRTGNSSNVSHTLC